MRRVGVFIAALCFMGTLLSGMCVAVETIEVVAYGRGNDRGEAVDDAVRNALFQVAADIMEPEAIAANMQALRNGPLSAPRNYAGAIELVAHPVYKRKDPLRGSDILFVEAAVKLDIDKGKLAAELKKPEYQASAHPVFHVDADEKAIDEAIAEIGGLLDGLHDKYVKVGVAGFEYDDDKDGELVVHLEADPDVEGIRELMWRLDSVFARVSSEPPITVREGRSTFLSRAELYFMNDAGTLGFQRRYRIPVHMARAIDAKMKTQVPAYHLLLLDSGGGEVFDKVIVPSNKSIRPYYGSRDPWEKGLYIWNFTSFLRDHTQGMQDAPPGAKAVAKFVNEMDEDTFEEIDSVELELVFDE